mgnify:FL=1
MRQNDVMVTTDLQKKKKRIFMAYSSTALLANLTYKDSLLNIVMIKASVEIKLLYL